MKILTDIQQNSDEWFDFREGKITGSTIGKLFAKSRKIGEMFDTEKPLLTFYQKIAERLAIGARDVDDEDSVSAREWGHIHEPEAIAYAAQALGIKREEIVTDFVWQDDNANFAESPDAYENVEKPTWAIEAKCLSSARHIMAVATNGWPKEYLPQVLNYFLVNDDLKIVYFVMYDPRFVDYPKVQLKIFPISRKDYEYEIEKLRDIREEAEIQIENIIKNLAKEESSGK